MMSMLRLDDGGSATAAVKSVVPVVKDIEEQKEEGDEAECFSSVEHGRAAVGPGAGDKRDDHYPKVGEDEVEQQDVAGVGGEEESSQVEDGSEDRNNESVDDIITAPASGDEVCQNAHDNDGGDPDNGRRGQEGGSEPSAGGGSSCACHLFCLGLEEFLRCGLGLKVRLP